MALFNRGFRVRSITRDREVDKERQSRLLRALRAEIAAITFERDGLKRRMDQDYLRAVVVLDTSGDFGARAPEDEQEISKLEGSAARASARIAELDQQILNLTELTQRCDAIFPISQ